MESVPRESVEIGIPAPAAAASKTFTVTLNKKVTGSRRLPYLHACLAACLTFMLAVRTDRFEYASSIKQSTRESLSTLVQKGS